MCFAFSWIVAASFIVAPTSGREWLSDYGKALEATKESQRPLLIVIDEQPKWRAHIAPASETGQISPALLKKYTLCHVDASTPYGKAVAQAFRTAAFPTTVIIDKTGAVQLTKRTGRLSPAALTSMLVAYQNGKRPVEAARPSACRT